MEAPRSWPERRRWSSAIAQFPVVCFTLTLLTDVAYWRTADLMWLNFSCWLLLAGVVTAGVAGAVAILESLLGVARPSWAVAMGSVAVFVLAVLNNIVHAGDGWTAVVPWGLTLSVATVVLIVATSMVRRRSGNSADRERA